jgi:hypothetical protein
MSSLELFSNYFTFFRYNKWDLVSLFVKSVGMVDDSTSIIRDKCTLLLSIKWCFLSNSL